MYGHTLPLQGRRIGLPFSGEGMAMRGGELVTPSLRLLRPLAQGGMGCVWVAEHLALSTQVAVKFMMPEATQDAELVARFRREATAAAQIRSPHIAQVFDHGVTADGSLYIVMELLEGEDLKQRAGRLGVLPVREVVQILRQTASALGRAHQLGIVHRDIKPANLFLLDLDGEPFVKILDFGIAKQHRGGELGMTATGGLMGTPLYMSPEQLLSAKHVGPPADLWALGVVAYHLLTGKLPFTGETLGALAVAVHSAELTLPSTLRPELPPAVDAWMEKALARNPAARFPSAKEMASALEAATTGVDPMGAARSPASRPTVDVRTDEPPRWRGVAQPVVNGVPGEVADGRTSIMGGQGAQGQTFRGVVQEKTAGGSRRPSLFLVGLVLGTLSLAGSVPLLGGWSHSRAVIAEPLARPTLAWPSLAATTRSPSSAAVPGPTSDPMSTPTSSPTADATPSADARMRSTKKGAASSPSLTPEGALRSAPTADGANTKRPRPPGSQRRHENTDDVGF
ncbi:protein kinase [Chondromyces crocatus]|uniref:Protein kinase n=2 Tax=Chondromyces crocatus TaxID=52 RepID=A0A0K1EBD8_CHOCO|nr:protein kinase [Chondromyces crocatus]